VFVIDLCIVIIVPQRGRVSFNVPLDALFSIQLFFLLTIGIDNLLASLHLFHAALICNLVAIIIHSFPMNPMVNILMLFI